MAVPTSITQISTTASSNSPAGSDSIGNPGTIDDYFRGYGAVMRAESLNKSWERWNDTPTYISATQFSVTSDKTSRYVVNRRVKCTVTAGTVYGYISASAFSAVTTVTVVLDSGSLDSGLSEVQLAPETFALGPGVTGVGGNRVFSAGPTFTGTVTMPGSGKWDSSGNIGVGATPAAWAAGSNAVQLGTSACLIGFGAGSDMHLTNNAFYDGAWKFLFGSGAALAYDMYATQNDGLGNGFVFRYSSSGTANGAITWTELGRITPAGGLKGFTSVNQVTTASATAQSANIAKTALYAVTADGWYRVSLQTRCTRAASSTGATAAPSLYYTDPDSGTEAHFTGSTGSTGSDNVVGYGYLASFVIYAKSGTNISYDTFLYSSTGGTSLQYAFRATVDKVA